MMGTESNKMDLGQCPICGERTFRLDPDLGANRCFNELCRWNDKIGTAYDVPISFLEFCFLNAKSSVHKQYIGRVIEETKKATKRIEIG
jgi:hypothetical protein